MVVQYSDNLYYSWGIVALSDSSHVDISVRYCRCESPRAWLGAGKWHFGWSRYNCWRLDYKNLWKWVFFHLCIPFWFLFAYAKRENFLCYSQMHCCQRLRAHCDVRVLGLRHAPGWKNSWLRNIELSCFRQNAYRKQKQLWCWISKSFIKITCMEFLKNSRIVLAIWTGNGFSFSMF